jgi:hypothetical protein
MRLNIYVREKDAPLFETARNMDPDGRGLSAVIATALREYLMARNAATERKVY